MKGRLVRVSRVSLYWEVEMPGWSVSSFLGALGSYVRGCACSQPMAMLVNLHAAFMTELY
jgi:hypothetical protein